MHFESDAGGRIFDHQSGRPLRVAMHPLRVDVFPAKSVENAIACGIRAHTADPGHMKPEAREANTGVALGPGVIHQNGFAIHQRLARSWRQRDHRLAERDEIVFLGFRGVRAFHTPTL